jgi:hypothetical protein
MVESRDGHITMLEKRLLCLFVAVLVSAGSRADAGADPDLKQIMQGLRDDAALVLDGLLIDEFDAVAQAAARIAGHPQIPATQIRLVAAELGPEMGAFKQFDALVHELAIAIRSAALEKDRGRAISDYQQMIGACLACHASYRQRVADALSVEGAAAE